MVVIIGEPTEADIELAAKVTVRYSKGKDEEFVTVKYGKCGKPSSNIIEVRTVNDSELEKYIIN